MQIVDKRFGAEIVTAKGKVYKFDAIECMQSFEKEQSEKLGNDFAQYLVDSTNDGKLIPIESAFIFEDTSLRSPMGKGYLTSSSEEELKKMIGSKSGAILPWNEFKKTLK